MESTACRAPSPSARRGEAGRVLAAALVLGTGVVGILAWLLVDEPATAPTGDRPAVTMVAPIEVIALDLPSTGAGVRTQLAPEAAPIAAHEAPPTAQPVAASPTGAGYRFDRERWDELRELLRHDQPAATRLAAAHQILDEELGGPLVGRALEIVAQLDPASLPGELQRLLERSADDPQGQVAVAQAIRNIGQRDNALSTADLAFFFDTGDDQVAIAAAATLAERGDNSLSLRLQQARAADLASEDHLVRLAAVRDISEAGRAASIPTLLPLLADGSELVRAQVLESLQRAEDPALLERIRPLLDDPSPRVSRQATRLVQSLERRLQQDLEREEREAQREATRAQRRPLVAPPRGGDGRP